MIDRSGTSDPVQGLLDVGRIGLEAAPLARILVLDKQGLRVGELELVHVGTGFAGHDNSGPGSEPHAHPVHIGLFV